MASFYGTDASNSALEARYVSVLPTAVTPHAGGIAAALDKLISLPFYQEANIVLLPTSDLSSIGYARIAQRCIADGKRLGVAVRWDKPADTSQDSCGLLPMVGFVEGDDPNRVTLPAASIKAPDNGGWTEGNTADFTCEELLGSICIVPGLVFDGQGYYVGSDQGAYARFLRFYPGYKIALVDTIQVSSNPLPHTLSDIPVDYLITPGSVWNCR